MIRITFILIAFCVVCLSTSVAHGAFTFSIDQAAAWQAAVPEVAAFPQPTASQTGIPMGTQSVATTQGTLTYNVFNRDTKGAANNADLLAAAGASLGAMSGTIADLFLDTNGLLDTEDPADQGGATATSGTVGYDSSGGNNNNSSGGLASRNAAYFTFNQSIVGFNVDLLDFETTAGGQEGLLVLGLGGDIIDSQTFTFPNDNGDGEIHNVGITSSGGMVFDSVMFILGDDNDPDISNGYGGSEFWAAANVVAAVPEPSSFMFIGLLTVAGVGARRYRKTLR